MWKQSYSQVFEDISKEAIWKIWRDVNNWHQWRSDVDHCKLNGPFLAGSSLMLKPNFGPSAKVELIIVEKNQRFAECMSFLGGKMYTSHEIDEVAGGLKLTTSIHVTGPFAFVWRKLSAKKMANALPEQTRALVNLCKIEADSIRTKVNAANKIAQPPIIVPTEAFTFEDPEKNPGLLLWQSTMNWQQSIKKGLDPHQISHTQFAIIFITLWSERKKQTVTQANICAQSKLDKVTVSKALKGLEEKGYIQRLINENDTRTKRIKLTPKGKKLAESLVDTTQSIDKAFFKELQNNETMFIDMMKTLGSTALAKV